MAKTMKAAPKKRGRPKAEFDQGIADRICALVEQGLTLEEICRRKKMPSDDTVRRWKRENATFNGAFARAREERGDAHRDKVKKLIEETTPKNYNAKRVQIDGTKWLAGTDNARYSDRPTVGLQVNVGGPSQVERENSLLETARGFAYIMRAGAEIERKRHVAALLPAPSETEGPSAELKGHATDPAASTPIPTPASEQSEAERARWIEAEIRRGERQTELEVAREIRRMDSPLQTHSRGRDGTGLRRPRRR